jgi:hypothetical protein
MKEDAKIALVGLTIICFTLIVVVAMLTGNL